MVLLLRLDAILCRLVIDRVVHRANLLVVTVSLQAQFLLEFTCFLHLALQFLGDVGDFSIQVPDLFVFALTYQCKLVLGSFILSQKLGLFFLPLLHLRLEELNFVLKVVHMDLHLMFQL